MSGVECSGENRWKDGWTDMDERDGEGLTRAKRVVGVDDKP